MKKLLVLVVIVLVLGVSLVVLVNNPYVSNKVDIPDTIREAVESQAKGIYSNTLPLVPIYVSVDSFAADKVFYTIYYFPFGTEQMSYVAGEGYNIEKTLIGS